MPTKQQAHEVRNPLSVAIGGTHFIKTALRKAAVPNASAVCADLDMVAASLTFIEELLTSSLDLQKFNEGKIALRSERCSLLEDVLRPVVTMLSSRSNPTLEVTVECGNPLWVEATDPLRLKQLMMNLGKNAVKFVSSGFVRLGARREGPGDVVLWVEDSGPGVATSKAVSLFDKYTQCNVEDQGTGIGLALVKQIAEALGGTVALDLEYTSGSKHGPGARFVVSLPLAVVAAPTPPGVVMATTSIIDSGVALLPRGPYRVLIVDDDAMIRLILRRNLELISVGWRIDEVENGEACLEALEHTKYDVITMDQASESCSPCNPLPPRLHCGARSRPLMPALALLFIAVHGVDWRCLDGDRHHRKDPGARRRRPNCGLFRQQPRGGTPRSRSRPVLAQANARTYHDGARHQLAASLPRDVARSLR